MKDEQLHIQIMNITTKLSKLEKDTNIVKRKKKIETLNNAINNAEQCLETIKTEFNVNCDKVSTDIIADEEYDDYIKKLEAIDLAEFANLNLEEQIKFFLKVNTKLQKALTYLDSIKTNITYI